eukprot:762691-Hanusia_phi.AAC.1
MKGFDWWPVRQALQYLPEVRNRPDGGVLMCVKGLCLPCGCQRRDGGCRGTWRRRTRRGYRRGAGLLRSPSQGSGAEGSNLLCTGSEQPSSCPRSHDLADEGARGRACFFPGATGAHEVTRHDPSCIEVRQVLI